MFTGIIQTQGRVETIREADGGREITVVSDPKFFATSAIGDSVAHDGVCLTVTSKNDDSITVFAMVETLSKTSVGQWDEGTAVNLELPLRMGDPLGGHIVQGHVDCTTVIFDIEIRDDGSWYVTFELPSDIDRYIVDRGSVCINGVSLTVANRDASTFSVALIPETLKKTTFAQLEKGSIVNIEIDNIARYVEQMIRHFDRSEES